MTAASIDNEQPKSIEEHFKLILDCKALVDPKHSNVTAQDLPSWFDEKLFKKGQDFFKNNRLSVSTAGMSGLMAVFLIPSISKVLVFTEKSSTPCLAFKRYFETVLHITNLYISDFKDSESEFYKSLNTIRWKHSTSSKRYNKKNEDGGILQKDMVLTQFGFIGYVLVNPSKLGLSENFDGVEAFNHFWRVTAHLLGIPDRINLCRKNHQETTLLCKKILKEVYGKHLDNPSKKFLDLTFTSMSGLSCLDPLVDMDAFFIFLYDLHNKTYEKQISWSSKFNANFRKFNFYLISTPYIGFVARHYWNLYIRLSNWFHAKWPIVAWMRYGKAESKIHLYPALL